MICTHCQQREKNVDIFVFLDGVNSAGVRNTKTIARLCSVCADEYFKGAIKIEEPTYTLEELFKRKA